MRYSVLVLFLFSALYARAQSFEGTVKWAIKMEYKDSTRQAQMMKDQETSTRPNRIPQDIPEGQEMPQPPQGSAPAARPPKQRAPAFPTALVFKTKNGNARIKTAGGGRDQEVLYLKEKDESYSL